MNDIDLDTRVADIRRNVIAEKSRIVYTNSICRFLEWLHDNKPNLLTTEFSSAVRACTSTTVRSSIKHVLDHQPSIHPVHFRDLDANVFINWIVTLKKKDGGDPSFASYNSHRSGLFNLYRIYGQEMPSHLSSQLKTDFRGLKRKAALTAAAGETSCKVGKDPMSFGLYRFLSKKMMKGNARELVFARCFFVLTWNLMSRASNTLQICYDHIEFNDDAFSYTLLSKKMTNWVKSLAIRGIFMQILLFPKYVQWWLSVYIGCDFKAMRKNSSQVIGNMTASGKYLRGY